MSLQWNGAMLLSSYLPKFGVLREKACVLFQCLLKIDWYTNMSLRSFFFVFSFLFFPHVIHNFIGMFWLGLFPRTYANFITYTTLNKIFLKKCRNEKFNAHSLYVYTRNIILMSCRLAGERSSTGLYFAVVSSDKFTHIFTKTEVI